MDVARSLNRHGFKSLKVLAALKPAKQILNRESVLIAEEITSVRELPSRGVHVYRVHPEIEFDASISRGLAQTLARLHKAGFFHGDLKSRHVLCRDSVEQGTEFFFVDLEKCRQAGLVPSVARDLFASRDLIQLLNSLDFKGSEALKTDAFLEAYFLSLDLSSPRQKVIRRLVDLYGPCGSFSQGSTLLQNAARFARKSVARILSGSFNQS